MPLPPERRREWEKERWHRRRSEWFASKSCVECGSTEQLELDHIDPATKVAHNVWNWGDARREAELAKCQPLCRNCHNAKHNGARRLGHGTVSNYDKRRCRCELCKAAKLASVREYYFRVQAPIRMCKECGCHVDLSTDGCRRCKARHIGRQRQGYRGLRKGRPPPAPPS